MTFQYNSMKVGEFFVGDYYYLSPFEIGSIIQVKIGNFEKEIL